MSPTGLRRESVSNPRSRSSFRLLATIPLAFMLLIGCKGSEKLNDVSGKLVLPGTIKVIETDSISLTFKPTDSAATKSYPGIVSVKDMSFTVKAPAGKYKVEVKIQAYPGAKESKQRSTDFEAFNKAFGAGTPLNYEVTSDGTQTITIDIAKKTVTKS